MKPRILLPSLAILILAALLAIRAAHATSQANAERARLVAQRDHRRQQVIALEGKVREIRAATPAAEQVISNQSDPIRADAGAAFSAKAKPAAVRKLSATSRIANDPQKMAEFTKNFRDSLDLDFGGLFRALGLSPEQIEQVKDLKVWFQQADMDMRATFEAEGVVLQGEAWSKMTTDLWKKRLAKVREILGPSGLAGRYEDYDRLTYLLRSVRQIASADMLPEAPASFAQVNRAAEIIAQNNQRRDEKKPEKWNWQIYGWSWQDWAEINWQVAEPQLQRELSPSQYARLRELLHTQEAWTAVASRNSANQREARRRASQPGG